MRLGDWILCLSIMLNIFSFLAYAYEKHFNQTLYFLGVLILNCALLRMK
jgi:hypothetical protein